MEIKTQKLSFIASSVRVKQMYLSSFLVEYCFQIQPSVPVQSLFGHFSSCFIKCLEVNVLIGFTLSGGTLSILLELLVIIIYKLKFYRVYLSKYLLFLNVDETLPMRLTGQRERDAIWHDYLWNQKIMIFKTGMLRYHLLATSKWMKRWWPLFFTSLQKKII